MTDLKIKVEENKLNGETSPLFFNRIVDKLKKLLLDEDMEPQPPRSKSEYILDYSKLILIASIIIAFDQISKNWIRATIPYGQELMTPDWLPQFVRIVNWSNTGAAFGIFQDASLIFTFLAFFVAFMILVYYSIIPANEKIQRFTLSMMLGGALGNLIDRLQFGEVTDFIAVGSFPVFNVADSSITVGVAIMIVAYIFEWRKMKKAESE